MQFAKTFFVVELLVEYGSYLKQMTRTQFAQFISEITFQGDNDKSGFLLWNQNEKIIPITFYGQVYNFNVDSDNIDSICTRLGYKFDLQRMINQHNAYYSSVISEQITPSRLNIHIFLAMLAQYVCDECGKEDPDVWCQACYYWFHSKCLHPRYQRELNSHCKFINKCDQCHK